MGVLLLLVSYSRTRAVAIFVVGEIHVVVVHLKVERNFVVLASARENAITLGLEIYVVTSVTVGLGNVMEMNPKTNASK